jgi:hypothetical protein
MTIGVIATLVTFAVAAVYARGRFAGEKRSSSDVDRTSVEAALVGREPDLDK